MDPGSAHWKEKAALETEGQGVGVTLVPCLALPASLHWGLQPTFPPSPLFRSLHPPHSQLSHLCSGCFHSLEFSSCISDPSSIGLSAFPMLLDS